jgi:hypothetical protein
MSSREIFKEFEFLLEKSQRSFNRLRDLPPYGNSRWEHHFHKAFHIYSKLWKFQQENRWDACYWGTCALQQASTRAAATAGAAAACTARVLHTAARCMCMMPPNVAATASHLNLECWRSAVVWPQLFLLPVAHAPN